MRTVCTRGKHEVEHESEYVLRTENSGGVRSLVEPLRGRRRRRRTPENSGEAQSQSPRRIRRTSDWSSPYTLTANARGGLLFLY
jgi:hypothetical protein